jgi:pimeloyl-ACP methyl ester carboxylesterase
MMGAMEVTSTDGVTLALHDLGGAGPPLLSCHAAGFCGLAYTQLAARLGPRFHVWAMDFRGHGDATVPDGDRFDWRGMADDFLAVVDAIGAHGPDPGPLTVFGHSMGGGAMLLAEARRPGTVAGAFLFEPIVLVDSAMLPGEGDNPNPLAEGARRRRATFDSRAEALLRYASRPPLDTLQAGSLAAYVVNGFADQPDGTVTLKCRPEHEAATFDAPGKPTLDDVRVVQTPTTIAIGSTAGGWSPAMFGAAVAEVLPHGRLEVHPTLGHFGPLEDPATVATAVIAARP